MHKLFLISFQLLLLFIAKSGWSSNLVISNVSLIGSDKVKFTIKWDNSWRNGPNLTDLHDGVWIFVKYKSCSAADNQPYKHAKLFPNASTVFPLPYVIPSELQANPVPAAPNNVGILIRRSEVGSGVITEKEVTLRLIAGQFFIPVDIKVFGIEMAYIQQGSFQVGDGAAGNRFGTGSSLSTPFTITTEGNIPVGTASNQLYSRGQTSILPITTGVPTHFPKGYKHFYCMKTEITVQQYADFLNSLSNVQYNQRWTYMNFANNNWPEVTPAPVAKNRSATALNWEDLLAYLDWSGLRPLTELEFEKVCRGPVAAKPGDYAWGNQTFVKPTGKKPDGMCETVENQGSANIANCNTQYGALSVGFLGNRANTREVIGASYYGNLELSGNVMEQVVTVSIIGINYTGATGDGVLDEIGYSNVSGWPETFNHGHTYRGGDWHNGEVQAHVSNRDYVNHSPGITKERWSNVGGRGCLNVSF